MKVAKLILFMVLLALCTTSKAQEPADPSIGRPGSAAKVRGKLYVNSYLYLAYRNDLIDYTETLHQPGVLISINDPLASGNALPYFWRGPDIGWKRLLTEEDLVGGGSGIQDLGTLDSEPKDPRGGTRVGENLILQTADGTYSGLMSDYSYRQLDTVMLSPYVRLTELQTPDLSSVLNSGNTADNAIILGDLLTERALITPNFLSYGNTTVDGDIRISPAGYFLGKFNSSGGVTLVLDTVGIGQTTYNQKIQPKAGTIALLSDIPTISDVDTSVFSRLKFVNLPLYLENDSTISLPAASNNSDGYLSTSDWLRFDSAYTRSANLYSTNPNDWDTVSVNLAGWLGSSALRVYRTGNSTWYPAISIPIDGESVGVGGRGLAARLTAGTATGVENVAVGEYAGGQATTGSYNTWLGKAAGYNVTTANSTIYIGRNVTGLATEDYRMQIGEYILGQRGSGFNNARVAIGGISGGAPATIDTSAVLELISTNKGFLMPRMTLAQSNAIVLPAAGLMVYIPDSSKFRYYNGSTWGWLTSPGGGGSGTVNSGTANRLSYYSSTGTTVSELAAITANRVLLSNANGLPEASSVTNTTLGYLDATSSIQTQLNGKQAGHANLTAFSSYNTNGLITQTASGTYAGRTITGTSNRLTVTNGNGVSGNPTLDIASTYVGQTSITTLGTIGTGTWQGTAISTTYGGIPTGGTTGQVLTKTSGSNYAVSWQTPSGGGGIDTIYRKSGQDSIFWSKGGNEYAIKDSVGSGGGGGGITRSVSTISTNTTGGTTSSTDYVYLASGNITFTLPSASGNTNTYTIIKTDSSNVVTIANAWTAISLDFEGESRTFISNGTTWYEK